MKLYGVRRKTFLAYAQICTCQTERMVCRVRRDAKKLIIDYGLERNVAFQMVLFEYRRRSPKGSLSALEAVYGASCGIYRRARVSKIRGVQRLCRCRQGIRLPAVQAPRSERTQRHRTVLFCVVQWRRRAAMLVLEYSCNILQAINDYAGSLLP